jgi:two-component system, NtrC family, sensor kinase
MPDVPSCAIAAIPAVVTVAWWLARKRRQTIERVRVDLNQLVASTARTLEATARGLDSAIVYVVGDAVDTIGCPSELEQVLASLIVNGLRAMTLGGVVCVQCRTEPRVDRAGQPQRFACVSVTDRGDAIAPADLPRLFEQVTAPIAASGLGLSASYRIIRDHGGTIEVQSDPARGTKFSVLLPLAA